MSENTSLTVTLKAHNASQVANLHYLVHVALRARSRQVSALVIYPFIIQFVRDTDVTGGDETKTGNYRVRQESVFFLAACLTVVYFGRLSDRYGRRPVLLLGPVGLSLAMLGFGSSKKIWSLVFFRFIQGAFNGNNDSTSVAEIYSLLPFMWSIGSTLGPFIGGSLANPASRFPDSLGKIHLLREFPYLLPCATAGALALGAFIFGVLGLKETLPSAIARQKKGLLGTEVEPLLSNTSVSAQGDTLIANDVPHFEPSLFALCLTRSVIVFFNYACFLQPTFCFKVMIPLVYATPVELNGLGLSPLHIGRIMGLCGFLNMLPRPSAGRIDSTVILIMIFQMSCSFVVLSIFACTQIFIVDSAPSQKSLGSVNGLAQMVAATLRSIAPSFASSLFSTSVSHHLLGGYFVFFVLCSFSLCAVWASLLLPKKLRH
ncbi:major facilitator superfamily domain-containing protein [Mycena alexandri]|uniref:Major facilitator superfamily domain-containing protein n=1 Tax=Mycena alexandri TaxID=1745969 RepID=A0AAD6T2S7_9AGAR|nr:major facilitator superfamily domain-containing protein [Mycena alexandri]